MAEEEKDPSLGKKIKEGVSMHDLENFARKYTNELHIIVAIFVASISSIFDFFIGTGWAISFAGLCAILGVAFPKQIIHWQRKIFELYEKQEKMVQIIIGVAHVVIALFLPFIVFAEIGFLAGEAFHGMTPRVERKEFSGEER